MTPEPTQTIAAATGAGSLAPLVGAWRGGGELFPNPWGASGPVTGRWRFWFDHARRNLIHDYVEQRADGSMFEGFGVLTIDPPTGEIVWFWFDSYGYPPHDPARGGWVGSELQLQKTTPRGVSRTRFQLSPGRLAYSVEARLTGADAARPVMSGVFVPDGSADAVRADPRPLG